MENENAKTKKPICKRIWFITLVSVVFLAASTAAIVSQKNKEVIATYVPIHANDMLNAYSSDEISADLTYKDKFFEITGTVASVNTVPYQTCVSLKNTEDETMTMTLQCFFQDLEQRTKAKALKEGDVVTLKGKCTGLTYHISIDKCRLVE